MKFNNSGKEIKMDQLTYNGADLVIPAGDFTVEEHVGNYIIYLCNHPGWEEVFALVEAVDDPAATPKARGRRAAAAARKKVAEEQKEEEPKVASTKTLPKQT